MPLAPSPPRARCAAGQILRGPKSPRAKCALGWMCRGLGALSAGSTVSWMRWGLASARTPESTLAPIAWRKLLDTFDFRLRYGDDEKLGYALSLLYS